MILHSHRIQRPVDLVQLDPFQLQLEPFKIQI